MVGAPTHQFDYNSVSYWQLYEITNFLDPSVVPVITKVPNQPTNFNNISPIYGSDDRIIFTSDRPRNGEPRRVEPVYLAHAHADRGAVAGEQDGVGFHRTHGTPGELEIVQCRSAGGLTGNQAPIFHRVARRAEVIARLHQVPT